MRQFWLIIVLLTISTSLYSRDSIAKADSAYRAFNYTLAIELYEAAKDDCATAEVFIKLADSYFFGGYEKPKNEQELMYVKARETLELAIAKEPNNPNIYARLGQVTGQIALFKGNKEKIKLGLEIKQYADKALLLDKNNAMANAVLGIWHYELANLGLVERTFAKILFGGIPEGSYEQSAFYLKIAVSQNPNIIFYRNAYAKTLLKLNREQEAIIQLKTALKLPYVVAGDKQNKVETRTILEHI